MFYEKDCFFRKGHKWASVSHISWCVVKYKFEIDEEKLFRVALGMMQTTDSLFNHSPASCHSQLLTKDRGIST